jgi:hypothetical protein
VAFVPADQAQRSTVFGSGYSHTPIFLLTGLQTSIFACQVIFRGLPLPSILHSNLLAIPPFIYFLKPLSHLLYPSPALRCPHIPSLSRLILPRQPRLSPNPPPLGIYLTSLPRWHNCSAGSDQSNNSFPRNNIPGGAYSYTTFSLLPLSLSASSSHITSLQPPTTSTFEYSFSDTTIFNQHGFFDIIIIGLTKSSRSRLLYPTSSLPRHGLLSRQSYKSSNPM